MERHERTFWGFVVTLLVIALLALSIALPWWTYKYSTGLRTPPDGPQDPEDTRIQRERLDIFPYRHEGHSNNTTAADLERTTGQLGMLVVGSLVVTGLIALLEVPVPFFFSTRWLTLILVPIGFLLALAGLLYTWFVVPDLFAHQGVDTAFKTTPTPDGYVQTGLNWGFAFGLVSCLVYPGIFLFKFQAGATDPEVIEGYRLRTP